MNLDRPNIPGKFRSNDPQASIALIGTWIAKAADELNYMVSQLEKATGLQADQITENSSTNKIDRNAADIAKTQSDLADLAARVHDLEQPDMTFASIQANAQYAVLGTGKTYVVVKDGIAYASINLNITSAVPSAATIATGFPIPAVQYFVFSGAIGGSGAAMRLWIDSNGELCSDGGISSTGWMNAAVAYPVH